MGLRSVVGAVGSMRGVYRPISERSHYLSRFAGLPFVFVHIPKNGGTAILDAIGLSRPRVHATAWELRSDHTDQLQGKELLAVYRDPIARFTSAWHYCLRGGNGGVLDRRLQRKFVRRVESGDLETIDGLKGLALMSRVFWPQTAYVLDPFGALAVDRVFDCSRLTDEFEAYCQSKSVNLPRAEKVNVADPAEDEIPNSTLEAARTLYRCDYALAERLGLADHCKSGDPASI